MSTVETAPTLGPCSSWVTAEEVALCCGVDVGTDYAVFESAAVQASMTLFELSARQFSGECEQTTRPCADGCGCWAQWLVWPAQVPAVPWGSAWGWGLFGAAGWGWGYAGCSSTCGCGTLSRALLPGYPVTEIIEVVIGGEVIDPSGYRLDEYQFLTRLADDNGNPRFWPACQRLDLEPGEPGTWTVTYLSGVAPPPLGVDAAKELACEIYRACASGGALGACALPSGVTKITRQGVVIERAPFVTWAFVDGKWASGMSLVDLFLQTYNPGGLRRRSAVWSPDLPTYGLPVPGLSS